MKEALKLALEALTYKKWFRIGTVEQNDPRVEAAITAIKEALALTRTQCEKQPAQEPDVEPACPVCHATPIFSLDRRVHEWSGQCKHCGVEGSPATTEAEAKQKWIVWHHKRSDTTPQQRPWVGLTDGERYRWLRKEYAEGRETYLAECVPSENALDEYIDRQMAKTSIKTERWSGK
jgi:hypothetical protein